MGRTAITRRALLAGAGAAAATGARAAWVPGTVGDAALPTVLRALSSVDQGTGAKVLSILVSPGCDHSEAMFEAAQGRGDAVRVRWVPFTGGPGGSPEALARVIGDGSLDALRAFLRGVPGARPGAVAWAAALAQDRMVERAVARMLWAATGRPMAAPTTVYAVPGGSVRVVRGSLPREGFDAVVEAAA